MEDRQKLKTFLEEVCAGPLMAILLRCAKYDQRVTNTTLKEFLYSTGNHIDLCSEGQTRQLAGKLYETDTEKVPFCVNHANVSFIIFVLENFFKHCISITEKIHIDKIKGIKNDLEYGQPHMDFSKEDTEELIDEIKSSAMRLADKDNAHPHPRSVSQMIDDKRELLFPNIRKRKTPEDKFHTMKNMLVEVRASTASTGEIVQAAAVKKQKRTGTSTKKMNAVDHILENMHAKIKSTFHQELPDNFELPKEVDDVMTKLDEKHCVVVTGLDSKLYLATALKAIEQMNLVFSRCVEMTQLSDWRHVDPEDVDLVLLREPFSISTNNERELLSVFDSMKYSVNNDNECFYVVIVSAMSELEDWKTNHCHDLLEEVVVVNQALTTEQTPIDLTATKDMSGSETHPILKNMIDQTDVFRRNVEKNTSFSETEDFCKAKEMFKRHKSILILGKKNSGKTTLAVQLMSFYSSGQCLIITDPSEWKHARLGVISVVLIEDFAGKYSYDTKFAAAWLTKFDQIYAAVQQGKVSVIITCGTIQFEKFKRRFNTHQLIEHMIEMTSEKFVKDEPMSPPTQEQDDEHIVADSTMPEEAMDTESTFSNDCDCSTAEVDPWDEFLQGKLEITEEDLLRKNQLPSKRQLEIILEKFEGKQSSTVMIKCCSKICEYIKNISKKISGVFPTYRIDQLGKVHIAFVICANEDIDLKNRISYEYKIRVKGKCSTEAMEVAFSKENTIYKMNPNDAKQIKTFIQNNSKELLSRHKMLSGISASCIKSKNHGTDKWEKIACPCVVFYVHTKYYIPLEENPFKTEYDGISVDVREGALTRLGRHGHCSTDFQPDVKIACEVSGCAGSGTLSGYIDRPDSSDTFAFTCAHAVVSPDIIKKNLSTRGITSFHYTAETPTESIQSFVYQPAGSNEILGNIEHVVLQEGENKRSGMAIALIKLQKARCPLSGKISDFEDKTNDHTFESGTVIARASIQHCEDVVKFGSRTGITQGRVAFDGTTIREIAFPWEYGGVCISLLNQLEVWPCNFHEKFADYGDSGAPVFVSRNDELSCVGIIEGGYDCGFCAVTPIDGFISELNISSLKVFGKAPSTQGKMHKSRRKSGKQLLTRTETVESKKNSLFTKDDVYK